MLNNSEVLNYVKMKLGIPFTPIEYIDSEILEYIRTVSLRTFSKLMPHVNKISMDLDDQTIHTDVKNEFRILDPDNVSIIGIVEILFDKSNLILAGFPYYGNLSTTKDLEHAANYVYDIETAATNFKYSQFRQHFEFVPPNILRILPTTFLGGVITVIYERFHTPDFRTILPEFEETFLDLAYADVALWLSRTRNAFRTFNTPFGDIELNTEELKSDAQTLRDKIIEDLSVVNPSIIVDTD